jgi:signal transduction histidine kinase
MRMFASSNNDAMILRYENIEGDCHISLRVVDKVMVAHEWLLVGTPDFDGVDALCAMASAKMGINVKPAGSNFPLDLALTIMPVSTNGAIPLRPRNAELFENIALEVERKRISQDLNDLVLPHLDKSNALADQSDNVLLAIAVRDRMQLILGGVKAIIGETHSHLLEQTGLVPSIMTLVDRFTRASLIETTIAADLSSADVNITSDAKFAIYRATQEALNNVEKHSGASLAGIAVRRDPDALVVQIEDNGKGMEQNFTTQSRGLKIIRERAEAIGAHVRWEKARSFESGTLVTISLPYDR